MLGRCDGPPAIPAFKGEIPRALWLVRWAVQGVLAWFRDPALVSKLEEQANWFPKWNPGLMHVPPWCVCYYVTLSLNWNLPSGKSGTVEAWRIVSPSLALLTVQTAAGEGDQASLREETSWINRQRAGCAESPKAASWADVHTGVDFSVIDGCLWGVLSLWPFTHTPVSDQNNNNLITSQNWTLVQFLLRSFMGSLSIELIYVLSLAWKSQSHINVYNHICKMCMHTCACHENET